MTLRVFFLLSCAIAIISCKKQDTTATQPPEENTPPIKSPQWNKIKTTSAGVLCLTTTSDSGLVVSEAFRGLFTTFDKGNSWIESASTSQIPGRVLAFGVSGDTIYAGNEFSNVFVSTNKGKTWSSFASLSSYVGVSGISALKKHGNYVFIGTVNGLYRCSLSGSGLTCVTNSLPPQFTDQNGKPHQLVFSLENIQWILFMSTSTGVFYTKTYGNSWVKFGNNLPNVQYDGNTGQYTNHVTKIIYTGSFFTLYAATFGSGVYKIDWENDSTQNWTQEATGLSDLRIRDLAFKLPSSAYFPTLYALTEDRRLFYSYNNVLDLNWDPMDKTGLDNDILLCVQASKNKIFLGSDKSVYLFE